MALQRRRHGGKTYINLDIQNELERLSRNHLTALPPESELAAVVIDIERSAVVALIGSGNLSDPIDGQVNGVLASRSPGSTLKPFLYAAAFEAGRLSPESMVYDVPTNLNGWSPSNFDKTFSGEVKAAQALRQSLNIPALVVTREIGLARCCGLIESLGIHLPANARQRSGLTLATGGIEVSLLELTNAYAAFGREGIYMKPRLFPDEPYEQTSALKPKVCAALNHVLSSQQRSPVGMEDFAPVDIPWFMWKTGTSSARRDAWAVGHNHRYAIGVWVGRFRGTGRESYVGALAAEPLLARLFALPGLRNDHPPTPPAPLVVTKPLPMKPPTHHDLRILQPENGTIYTTLNGKTVIHPTINTNRKLTWFLNGRMLTKKEIRDLPLQPGDYVLLGITDEGASTQVAFQVR
jgi:penicillin-binding protein 1C